MADGIERQPPEQLRGPVTQAIGRAGMRELMDGNATSRKIPIRISGGHQLRDVGVVEQQRAASMGTGVAAYQYRRRLCLRAALAARAFFASYSSGVTAPRSRRSASCDRAFVTSSAVIAAGCGSAVRRCGGAAGTGPGRRIGRCHAGTRRPQWRHHGSGELSSRSCFASSIAFLNPMAPRASGGARCPPPTR